MSEKELFLYMKKCALDKKKAPIRVTSEEVLKRGLSLLINNSNEVVRVVLSFNDSNKNSLLSTLSSELIISNTHEFLSNSSREFMILTDNPKAFKKSRFFDFFKGRVRLNTIPKNILDENDLVKRGISFVTADDDGVIIGPFQIVSSVENGEQFPTFINFSDQEFNKNLTGYFNRVRDKSLSGGAF